MSCVSEDELLGLVSGQLPSQARAVVFSHLDGCEVCRAVLTALAQDQEPSARRGQVGPYQLLERLGRGGMSELFLARRPNGQRCVIKRLLPELSDDREFQSRFRQEAALLATLSHPNVGRILDVGDDQGRLYLVLEHIDGPDFRGLLKRFKAQGAIAPAALTVELVRQAAEGLQAAHQAIDRRGRSLHLIHRDVNPTNLMVTSQGVVKVIDFGMAQATLKDATRTGVVLGKLHYFSPEQARGDRLDARTDVFALGLVFQELLTGRGSYAGAKARALEQDVALGRTPPQPPDEVWVLPALWALSRRCVEIDPRRRLQSMRELADALVAAQAALSLTLTADELAALIS